MKIYFLFIISLLLVCNGQKIQSQVTLGWDTDSYKYTSDQLLKGYPPVDSLYRNFRYKILHFNTSELAFIGNYNAALQMDYLFQYHLNDTVWKERDVERIKKESEGYSPTPAKEYILSKTGNKQIVIINEAHATPMHRVFTTSLLQGLYDQGFRYLALEALVSDSLLNLGNPPVKATEGYTRDPQFGNMIREAMALGYKFIAYEYDGDDWQTNREQGQARNIKKILDKDHNAKIVVHCGYGHGCKDTLTGKVMGAYLKEYTGVDPLTISQTVLSEHPNTDFEYSAYKALHADFPSVFVNKNGEPFDAEIMYDIVVYHPHSVYVNGRPTWLLEVPNRCYYFVPKKKIKMSYPLLAVAYVLNENYSNTVPIDIIELSSEKEIKALVLKKGKYKIFLRNSNGQESSFKAVIK